MKKTTKKMIALTLMCIMMLTMLCACGSKTEAPAAAATATEEVTLPEWTDNLSDTAKESVKAIISKGTLVLGTSADYAPWEFHTEIDGVDTIVGIDIEYAQYFADQLDVELEITDMSFDNLLISLSKGDFDVVLASIGSTPERAKAVDFTKEYYTGKQMVVVRAEDADKYTTTESLKGKPVAAQKGSVLEGTANEVAGQENVVLLEKLQDEISELLAGKVEAVFMDDLVAYEYEAAKEGVLVANDIGIVYEGEGTSVGIQKGNEGLVETINYLLDQISDEQQAEWLKAAQALNSEIAE